MTLARPGLWTPHMGQTLDCQSPKFGLSQGGHPSRGTESSLVLQVSLVGPEPGPTWATIPTSFQVHQMPA